MKSKLIKTLIICFVAAGIGTSGYFGYQKFFAAKPAVTAPAYITMKASRMNLQVNIQGTGAAYADSTKEVTAGVSGTISSLTLKVGDTVKAGDTLFTLDSDQLKQNVTKAQTSLDKLKLQLAQVKSEAAAAKAQAEAQAKAQAEAKAKAQAQTQVEGQTQTQSQTQSQSQVNTNSSSAEANQGGQSNNSGSSPKVNYDAEISRLNLDITEAQNNLAAAKEALNKTTVKAAIDGIITAVTATSGDNVQANTAVLTIMNPASTKIKVAVDELDIEKVKVGQKTEVKFDALKDKTYKGAVESVAITGKSSNGVTTYDVVVGIEEPAGIRFGMNANVNILVDSKENALVIPVEALIDNNGMKFVRVENNASGDASGTANRTNTDNNKVQNNQQAPENSTNTQRQNGSSNTANRQASGNRQQRANRTLPAGVTTQTGISTGRLVEIKTGLENENFIEVLEGISEGQKLIVELPQTSTTTNNNNNRNGFGGFGNLNPGARQQAPVSVPKNNNKNNK